MASLESNAISPSLVAGAVSVIVALFSYYASVRTVRAERQKLERELTRRLTERLYDLRLKHYPRAFEITEGLGKHSSQPAESPQVVYQQTYHQLREWKAAEVSLCISDYALARFYDLLNVLKRNPERGKEYSDVQYKNVWVSRNRFRGALRVDLGLLFDEEKTETSRE